MTKVLNDLFAYALAVLFSLAAIGFVWFNLFIGYTMLKAVLQALWGIIKWLLSGFLS